MARIRQCAEALVGSLDEHGQMSIQSQSDRRRPDLLRQRTRTVSDFCFACNTPWTLTCEQRNGLWVVFCTRCGMVRPPRRDLVAPSPW